jgi:hypothetical protein
MVTKKEIVVYRCAYCNEAYDNHSDADDCQEYCHDSHEEPYEDLGGSYYKCDMCDKKHDSEKEANECEWLHEEKQDDVYEYYIEQESRARLEAAANHKHQLKITAY